MEAAVIVAIAWRLGAELRRRDPLAERVVLTKAQYAACCARGIGRVLFERALRRNRPPRPPRPGTGGEDSSDARE